MLTGEYEHSIDPKKRLAIPAKLRGKLGDQLVVTRGLDQCLFVYPLKTWEEIAAKLGTLPVGQEKNRGFVRLLFSSASEVSLDSLGRILVPDNLKDYADLKKDVVIVGALNRLEIWDKERWATFRASAEKEIGNVAEKLGELGIY
jgi:MraZ protein